MMSIQNPQLSIDPVPRGDRKRRSGLPSRVAKRAKLNSSQTHLASDSDSNSDLDDSDEEGKMQERSHTEVEFSGKIYSSLTLTALDSLEKKDARAIESLASQILLPESNPESISIDNLCVILSVLAQNISRLDNKSSFSLIQAILTLNWNEESRIAFSETYATFLRVLISGLPKWWPNVADKLIHDMAVKSESKLQLHHQTLKYLIHVIPTSTNTLFKILKQHYPNKNASKKLLVNYVRNILAVIKYCEVLRKSIWSLLIENVIKLDVELQNELDEIDDDDLDDAVPSESDDEEDDEEEEEDEEEISRAIQRAETTENEDMLDSEDEEDDEEEYNIEIQSISDLSKKLDSIMKILLEAAKFSEEHADESIAVFTTLLSLFHSHILPTHYTRCVQYLLFHISQQHSQLTESFMYRLIEVAFSYNQISSNRVKAMQYLSSYIARAKQVSHENLIEVLKYLTQWCTEFVNERENEISNGEGGMERFKMLYCVFQGLLYIFCFRHKELKIEDEWILKLDKFFNNLVMSKFNPLKFCNETVVLIFARLAQQVDLCYCYTIIDKNKRERLSGVQSTITQTSQANIAMKFESKQEFLDLEAYFPFDPLILKKSKKIVNENYIQWENFDDSEDSD